MFLRTQIAALGAIGYCCLGGQALGARLYWNDFIHGSIQSGRLDGSNIETVVSGIEPFGTFDANSATQKIYWQNGSMLQSARLDGTQITDIFDFSVVSGHGPMRFESTSNQIYWSSGGSIYRINVDGTDFEKLIDGPKNRIHGPSRIAFDVNAGFIYWSESLTTRLARARFDGTEITTIADWEILGGGGIDFDFQKGKVYWAESGEGRIRRANLDGSNIETVVPLGRERPLGLTLDLEAGHIYWADYDGGRIRRSGLDGANITTIYSGLGGPADLYFVTPEPISQYVLWVALAFTFQVARHTHRR